MKTCLCLCLITAVLLTSCASMHGGRQPQLIETSLPEHLPSTCLQAFPEGQWQLVHAISFRMAGGVQGHTLGALVLTADDEIRCALMTMEGLTLFEARSRAEAVLEVTRALAPFDNAEFAAGLMRDVRTIFRRPSGTVQYGKIATGEPVCRYISNGQATDILPGEDGCWQIITYADNAVTRIIHAHACTTDAGIHLAGSLTLTAPGVDGYTLSMELIRAEPIAQPLVANP